MGQVPETELTTADVLLPRAASIRQITPFFIVIILDAVGFGIIAPLLAPLVAHASGGLWGAHSTSYLRHIIYGLILAAFPISFMIGAPILGTLSDYFGRKRVLFICLLGTLMGFICYALSFTFASIGLLLLAGFTSGSQGVAQAAMADISLASSDKAINIGVIAVAMTLGLVLGPFIGGELSNSDLVAWFSLTTPFYFVILLSIFNLGLLKCCIKESRNVNAINLSQFKQQWQAFLNLFKIKQTFSFLLVFFIFELGWSLYYQLLALLFAEHFHYYAQAIGLFLTYVGIILSFGLLAVVRVVVAYFEFKKIISASLFFGFLSLIITFITPGLLWQYLLVIPVTFAVALIYTALITLVSNQVAKDKQGLLMGTTDGLLALAFAMTGFLAGWLAYFNLYLPFLVAGLFWLAALVVVRYVYGFMS